MKRNIWSKIYSRIPLVGEVSAISAHLRAGRRDYQMRMATFSDRLLSQSRYQDPLRLHRSEWQMFSQGGEDGMLRETLRRVGEGNRRFLEIGVGDGLENNTSYLLLEGWSGGWIEGDPGNCELIERNVLRHGLRERLKLKNDFVTVENVRGIVAGLGIDEKNDIDVLSVDIDRNTYWIWQALGGLRPRVVIVEYNPWHPPHLEWVAPYDPAGVWRSNTFYGASLKAYENLGATLGYSLVGASLSGVNAIFVRDDLAVDKFCRPYNAANHYEPARLYLCGQRGYPPAFGG